MENLKNCKSCGKLFLKVSRNICPDCFQEEEDCFLKVKNYLDEHPNATVLEVSTETEVTQKQIKKFIEEGRLITTQFTRLSIECERCGVEISQGKYCESCQEELKEGFKSSTTKKEEQKEAGKIHIRDRLDKR
ncbi:TIGR03826 family flagellar region protein [Natranaerobius trueperi]|uniref:MerR family transcriptional regulator n=1 Tax=Natranaerobius trueperi TaxID=759412 RepID=A0A226C364_9FIRM|nr:TIGR03826 family flagellar region protein [Natranaerobius trueperi]OWZ84857.1 hypothetical protein CDO51_00165 [Natranaerobius trueperi]